MADAPEGRPETPAAERPASLDRDADAYQLVGVDQVNEWLDAGWEPIPAITPVYRHSMNLPQTMEITATFCFLHKEIDGGAVPRSEYERVCRQRDMAVERLRADPDAAAIATLDGLQKLLPKLKDEEDVSISKILDWIGVADDGEMTLADRVRILALEMATRQGVPLDQAERLCPEVVR